MSLTFIAVSITLYVLLVGSALYFCIFADPNTSQVAAFLTHTLPTKSWQLLERCTGGPQSRLLQTVEFVMDRALVIVYLAIICGTWSIVFYYIYPWIDRRSDYVPIYHKYIGYIVFLSCISSWRLASRTSPGIITARTLSRYNHYPYDEIMFSSGHVCPTKHILRLPRSKFDRYKYQEHVPRFDHYCGWVYNTIGQENYRFFLLFLLVHVTMCAYGAYCVGRLFYAEINEEKLFQVVFFDRHTGDEITSSMYIVVQYLFHRFLLEAAVLILSTVMCVALAAFLGYHVWLTSRGLTTNEAYKWDQVKVWYKYEIQRYNDAVKDGRIIANTSDAPADASPQPTSADNSNLTSATETVDTDTSPSAKEEPIEHPGPRPVNIYNRGLVENWKEVIFPLSLRSNALRSSASSSIRPNNDKAKTS